jgi:quinol monooxygenase YgiN
LLEKAFNLVCTSCSARERPILLSFLFNNEQVGGEERMANKLTVLARIRAKEGTEETLKRELLNLIEPTRAEVGCISYDLHQSADDKALFMFYETWSSKDDLDKHFTTPHIQAIMAKAPDLLAEPLDLSIWEKIS